MTFLAGPPYIRATGPIKSVAGTTLVIYCPFSGYPIESIKWEKSRQEISSSKILPIQCLYVNYSYKFIIFTGPRYETVSASNGGFLKIHNVDSGQDAGVYTCIVRSRTGEEARRDMQLTVNSMVATRHM